MFPSLDSLRAARQQGDAAATALLLAALLQAYHPASPLQAGPKRQFERCCAHLVATLTEATPVEKLLLAADVCFNHAYVIPGQEPLGYCPRHRP